MIWPAEKQPTTTNNNNSYLWRTTDEWKRSYNNSFNGGDLGFNDEFEENLFTWSGTPLACSIRANLLLLLLGSALNIPHNQQQHNGFHKTGTQDPP